MSSVHIRRPLVITAQVDVDAIILAFIDDLRTREGITENQVRRYRYPARHFLIWLECSRISLETVDGTVIDHFLHHDCSCAAVSASARLRRWGKRRTSLPLMKFVRFLERTGRIEVPGDLDDSFCLLDAFLKRLRGDGYAAGTIALYRNGCASLIAWLHLSRIRLRDLNSDAYARFRNRQFLYSIPGVYRGQRTHSLGTAYEGEIRKFLRYLVSIGQIEPLESAPEEGALSGCLKRFAVWLERNRGIGTASIRRHIDLIAAILPALGDDPGAYDAAVIRRVLFEHIEHRSRSHARKLTTTMRMYLRFLASEGRVAAALVSVVPVVPQWRLSTLPRHIPTDDVERTITSCGDDPVGVRDRAILLLLARLALRAGDIVTLRLADIDWHRAEIRVSGKTRRRTALPLPQDVGDALRAYITTVRPNLCEEPVFLSAKAPFRPFAGPSAVSKIARRALDRAEVTTFASRGAHVFRHSRATALLRSGATLDVIQSLLRHASRDTTMIYAKTDAVMLREVVQPWIGGIEK